jgi:hypothetical protein
LIKEFPATAIHNNTFSFANENVLLWIAVAGNSFINFELVDFVLLIFIEIEPECLFTKLSVYPLLESYALILKQSWSKDINDFMLLLLKDLPLEHIYMASKIEVLPEPLGP